MVLVLLPDVVDVMLDDRELGRRPSSPSDLQVDRSANAIVCRRSSTWDGLATAWGSGHRGVSGGVSFGRSSALHSTPGYPCNRKDGPTSRSTFFLHLSRMLSLAAVAGLLMALAVALEGGPRMIAALSIHLAVLIGVAAGSRVEGRATSARGRPRTVALRAPGGLSAADRPMPPVRAPSVPDALPTGARLGR